MADISHDPHSVAPLGSVGRGRMLRFAGLASFLSAWCLLSFTGVVSPLILPSPIRVAIAVQDVGTDLLRHILATVIRIAGGFALGTVLGVAIGLLMQFNRTVYALLDNLVETFRPVPPVALVPFIILIFGFAESGKTLVTTFGVALIMIVTTVEAIERVPTGVIRWGLVCGLPRSALFRHVILPAAWPEMRGGCRIGLALAVTLVVVSEFMGAKYGLGYLINVSKITLTTPTIFLSIIVLGWLGWGLDRCVRLLFDRTCSWDIRAKGATR